MPADERNRVRVASRYTHPAFSAVIDGVHKHTPCPLMTTTGAQRKPGVQARLAAESPKDSRRRSEEHTSELQSLMRISYAVFCLKKKKTTTTPITNANHNATKHIMSS